MVKIFFHSTKLLCFTMIGFLNASGQTDQGIIFKIFSESKIISKETELHQALDVLYFGQHDQLSKRIEEDVRKNFRAISGDLEFLQ